MSIAPPHSSPYRADVDGLRAIAVFCVVIFHAFPAVLPGGFVGVDVFFVISGYLITGLLLKASAAGSFSVADFYARRILRIFPGLLLVLAAVWGMGWLMLLPVEFQELGRHVTAGGWFTANLLYWAEAGYFDTTAQAKPLLHLWSLGVEEQFYLIWPWLLLVLVRHRRAGAALLGVIVVGSLAWSEWQVVSDPTAAYFSPLSRFWELAAGGLLALSEWGGKRRIWRHERLATLVATVGLGLLFGSCFWLDEHAQFPGWRAVPAVLGTVMVIGAGPMALPNRYGLASRPMVWLGLLSYGFYLWHWPLLSFLSIGIGGTAPAYWRGAALVLALALAWCSLHAFENRVRYGPRRRGLLWMIGLMTLVTALGWAVHKRHGFPGRLVAERNPVAATMKIGDGWDMVDMKCPAYPERGAQLPVCWSDKREQPVFAVWGDSKSDSLYWGLMRTSEPGRRWMALGRGVPIVGDDPLYADHQPVSVPALEALLSDDRIRVVVITSALRVLYHLPPGSDEHLPDLAQWAHREERILEGLGRTVQRLQSSGKRVVFALDNPTLPEPRKCLPDGRGLGLPAWLAEARWPANPACSMTVQEHLRQTARYRAMVRLLGERFPDMRVVDPVPVLCPSGHCAATDSGAFLYWRSDHISDEGSDRVGRVVNALLRND